jgi:hypothetical protein
MEFVGSPLVPCPFEKTPPISAANATTPAPSPTLRAVFDSSEDEDEDEDEDDRLDTTPPAHAIIPRWIEENLIARSLRKLGYSGSS